MAAQWNSFSLRQIQHYTVQFDCTGQLRHTRSVSLSWYHLLGLYYQELSTFRWCKMLWLLRDNGIQFQELLALFHSSSWSRLCHNLGMQRLEYFFQGRCWQGLTCYRKIERQHRGRWVPLLLLNVVCVVPDKCGSAWRLRYHVGQWGNLRILFESVLCESFEMMRLHIFWCGWLVDQVVCNWELIFSFSFAVVRAAFVDSFVESCVLGS